MSQRMIVTMTVGITAIALILVGAIIGRGAITSTVDSSNSMPMSTLVKQQPLSTTILVTQRLTSEQASAIALDAMPGAALMVQPVLVRYAGQAAYQVTLDKGLVYLVYIDATTGTVLSKAPPVAPLNGTTINKNEHNDERESND